MAAFLLISFYFCGVSLISDYVNLELAAGARMPTKATLGSIGYDVYALIDSSVIEAYEAHGNYCLDLPPKCVKMIRTGLSLARISSHYYLQVVSRSGLSARGVWVANAPGIIDSDYKGEICVLLYNSTSEPYRITNGDRIAQFLITPIIADISSSEASLSGLKLLAERSAGGFGSTGQ